MPDLAGAWSCCSTSKGGRGRPGACGRDSDSACYTSAAQGEGHRVHSLTCGQLKAVAGGGTSSSRAIITSSSSNGDDRRWRTPAYPSRAAATAAAAIGACGCTAAYASASAAATTPHYTCHRIQAAAPAAKRPTSSPATSSGLLAGVPAFLLSCRRQSYSRASSRSGVAASS